MNTTHAFVEIVVSGVLALASVLLLAFGLHVVDERWLLVTPEHLMLPVLAVSAYAFGVGFDRLWDVCCRRLDRSIRYQHFSSDDELNRTRSMVFAESERLSGYLDYIRTRMRIARNCAFLFPLLGIGGALALKRITPGSVWMDFVPLVAVAIAVGFLFLAALRNLLTGYYRQLRFAGDALRAMPASGKQAEAGGS